MPTEESREELEQRYRKAAQDYFREHMDGTAPPETVSQATQREITLASFELLIARRADVHLFNELLVRYPSEGRQQTGDVVPDNMVVVHDGPLAVDDQYDMAVQPARPFWVLDYISDDFIRKDYRRNFNTYEGTLKVPYCLTFRTEAEELRLYHHNGERYVSVKPNARQRHAIPELELEVALLAGWVRFWYRGELLLRPAELQRELEEARAGQKAAPRLEDKREV
jgi:Uma2 family endonuclease